MLGGAEILVAEGGPDQCLDWDDAVRVHWWQVGEQRFQAGGDC